MRWLRRILGAILLVLVLTVGLLFLLPAERIAQLAADQLRTVTGRDVSISGDVSMTVWPVLGVSAEGLEVGNAEWADQGPMLTTDRAAIGVNASALLRGEIQINFIEAASPTIPPRTEGGRTRLLAIHRCEAARRRYRPKLPRSVSLRPFR